MLYSVSVIQRCTLHQNEAWPVTYPSIIASMDMPINVLSHLSIGVVSTWCRSRFAKHKGVHQLQFPSWAVDGSQMSDPSFRKPLIFVHAKFRHANSDDTI